MRPQGRWLSLAGFGTVNERAMRVGVPACCQPKGFATDAKVPDSGSPTSRRRLPRAESTEDGGNI